MSHKTAEYLDCFYPVYSDSGVSTSFKINKIYDINLDTCLVEMEDILNEYSPFVNEIRLKSKWIISHGKPNEFLGDVGLGIVLPTDVIHMIRINFFDTY